MLLCASLSELKVVGVLLYTALLLSIAVKGGVLQTALSDLKAKGLVNSSEGWGVADCPVRPEGKGSCQQQ